MKCEIPRIPGSGSLLDTATETHDIVPYNVPIIPNTPRKTMGTATSRLAFGVLSLFPAPTKRAGDSGIFLTNQKAFPGFSPRNVICPGSKNSRKGQSPCRLVGPILLTFPFASMVYCGEFCLSEPTPKNLKVRRVPPFPPLCPLPAHVTLTTLT